MEHDQAWQHLSPSLLYVSPWTRATGAKLRTENGNDTMQSFSSCSLWNPALHLIFYSRLQVIRSQSQKKKKKGVDGFCLLLGCHTQNEERSNAATSPRGEEPGGAGTGSAVSQGPEMFPAQCPWCAGGAAGAGGLLQHCGDKTILLKKELHSGQGWLCLHPCWSCGYMGNISKL